MPKVSIELPVEINETILKHPEINWNKFISDTLCNYVKKIKLLDSITSKSKLTKKDVESLDYAIKADLLKKYQDA